MFQIRPRKNIDGNKIVDGNAASEVKSGAKRERKPLVKMFDRYIIRKFLGTYVFAILLLLAIVVMFYINDILDAML